LGVVEVGGKLLGGKRTGYRKKGRRWVMYLRKNEKSPNRLRGGGKGRRELTGCTIEHRKKNG